MALLANASFKNNILAFVAIAVGLSLVLYFVFSDSGGELVDTGPESVQETAEADAEASPLSPAFDLVRISRGGTGVIAGRMAPGAEVELYANGEKIADVVANEDGEWVIILDQPLEAGSVELNLKSFDEAAQQQTEAENVVVVSVPERETDRFIEREQNGVVAVLTPKEGDGASRILQKPGVAPYAEVGESLSVDTVDFGAGNSAVVTGRSLPRVDVRLYFDGTFVDSVRSDDNGQWQIGLGERAVSAGNHMIRVDQTVGDGQVQLRVEQPFTAGQPIDPTLAEGGVFVRPGNTLWQIARQLYGSGVRYTLIFGENSDQIADPDLIYPGQVFRLPPKS